MSTNEESPRINYEDSLQLTNYVRRTVSMTCRPCPTAGNQSEVAYGRKMTGEGPTYRERKTERVECGDCRKGMASGLLEVHRMVQHGKAKADRWSWTNAATGGGGGPTTYRIEFPTKGGDEVLPSGGLPGKGRDANGDEGTCMAQTCTGRRDHLGGGKPPSSKMPTMRHAGPVAVPK